MKSIRPQGNASTEQRFQKFLQQSGIRGWRRHLNLPERPDFAFRKPKKLRFFWMVVFGMVALGVLDFQKRTESFGSKRLHINGLTTGTLTDGLESVVGL